MEHLNSGRMPLDGFSGYELDRFLDFFGSLGAETERCLKLGPAPREVEVMVQLLRSHLRGRLETPSSLIAKSGLSRGTGHRTIKAMIASGLIYQRARTKSGRTFSLHPSPELIDMWHDFARRVIALTGASIGTAVAGSYFFGASYLSGSLIPPLPARAEKLALTGSLRILLHADPTFLAMQRLKRQFEMHFGVPTEVRAVSLDRLHDEILDNSSRRSSRFDVVTSDTCWMAELIEKGHVLPVEDMSSPSSQDVLDFHPEALNTVRRGSTLFGLPVQTTPELLIYRQDILDEQGLSPPSTLDELMALAGRMHNPERGLNGICWNGARGTPVGTTFLMLLADFGQSALNLPRDGHRFRDADLAPDNYRPRLLTDTALKAAEFLVELLDHSPDNVLQMSWYERAKCYAEGHAAMAYCYTQIMPMFLNDPASPAYGRTGFAPHPSARGNPQIAPLGGWNLCIPSNVTPSRVAPLREAVRTLTSAAATKLYIENGSTVSSRFSVCNDPSVASGRPIIPIVDRMARRGQIQAWPRPAVSELSEIVRILGEEIHAMLLRNKRPQAALQDAQARCDKLMIGNGRDSSIQPDGS
ncbi:MAG: extracellular solute-binding protein [Albidovulum sp.]|nr:extracellular solute-binding protein [Albidovulum sp.]